MDTSIMHIVLANCFRERGNEINISDFRKCLRYVKFNRGVHYKIINELKEVGIIKKITKRKILLDIEMIEKKVAESNINEYCIFKTKTINKKIKNSDWFT